ncbi:MAG TPA: hypothetical protein VK671_02625 [Mucilaginibacter sp.]|jgi:hypothetical protein|nr:hypothetical protein [Mucilaginibacter sp.]
MPTWRKPLLYFVSLVIVFFISVTIDSACGPEPDPYDYSVSFFHNDIAGGREYRAFYFTSGMPLYDEDEPVNEKDVNSREWAAYLGGKVKGADVKKAMYYLGHKTDSILLNGYLNLKNQMPDNLQTNTFLHSIRNNLAALLYYRFAKIMEPAVQTEPGWHNNPLDSNYIFKAAHDAEKEAKSTKDKFLKLRYYFQAQRLLHYTGHVKEAADIYDKYIANSHPGYYIKGLTSELRAGEEWRIGNNVKAAYLFSRIFTNFPERRVQAYQNFVWIKAPEMDLIALAKNNYEKAVIYAMNGFYTSRLSMEFLKKVYNTQPESPFVGILLAREINKLEGAYVTPKLIGKLPYNNLDGDYYGWNDYLKEEKNVGLHITELENFCSQLAEEHKCKHPEIGLLAKAYLEWVTGRNQEGFSSLGQIKNENLNAKLYDQKQMIGLLLVSQKIKKLDTATERELVPYLNWLNRKVTQELNNKGEPIAVPNDYMNERLLRFTWSARDFYQKLLTPMYLKQHDTTRAALAMLKGMPKLTGDTLRCYHQEFWENFTTVDFWQNYLHSSNLVKIIAYNQKAKTDPYLNVLTAGLKRTSSDCLYNLLGTAYLREHNYKKAIVALKKVRKHSENDFPSSGYESPRLKSNPFAEQLKDYPKNYHPAKTEIYSKLRFAEKMYELQKKAKQDPANASKYYYAMATGLYNTSFPGNAWFMITYVWMEQASPENVYFKQDLIGAVTAEKYYLKARELSNDPEFKAKCTFMAAKCKQQRYKGIDDEFSDYKFFPKHDPDFQKAIRHESYFGELKKYYAKTAFYKRAVNECSYLNDFLASADTKHNTKNK